MNTAKVIELSSNKPVVSQIKAKTEGSLDIYKIKRLLEYQLISKSVFVQLALAHDFGVGVIPDYAEWDEWIEKWDDNNKLNFGDVLQGLTKVYKSFYKEDGADAPILQLNLFEEISKSSD